MKKTGILNPLLSYELSELGHTDIFIVSDAGLPIPDHVIRIDLAVAPGVPRFLDVLEAILKEVVIEKAVLAREIKKVSPKMYKEIVSLLEKHQGIKEEDIVFVSHEEFKKNYVSNAKFVVRTGEFTPYTNIALVSGVPF